MTLSENAVRWTEVVEGLLWVESDKRWEGWNGSDPDTRGLDGFIGELLTAVRVAESGIRTDDDMLFLINNALSYMGRSDRVVSFQDPIPEALIQEVDGFIEEA